MNLNKCQCGCNKPVRTPTARFLPGHNGRGRIRPECERQQISKTMKRIMTPAMRASRGLTWAGKHHTEESKKKMSHAASLREQHKKEMRYVISQETRNKISIANTGQKRSEETKKKISEKAKGRVISPEQRLSISKTLSTFYKTHTNPFKNHHHTEVTKEVLRQANTGRFRGENGPNWRGGISSLPYAKEWTPWLKQEIKNRDNRRCQNPFCISHSTKFDIHHIDYDKQNCQKENLITLCMPCHGKTFQGDRSYWVDYYQLIQCERFGCDNTELTKRLKQKGKQK